MQDVRIALAVTRSPVSSVIDNLDKMEAFLPGAREQDAKIICFPEMNVTGYTTRADSLVSDSPDSGYIAGRIVDMAKRYELTVLAGFAETGPGGRLFASHACVTPAGEVAMYRKLYLAPPEKNIFSPAAGIPVFHAGGVTFGIQLCYDAHFPELSAHMALQGADIIFVPHASPRGTPAGKFRSWMRHLPARAYDNSVFVAACNQTGNNGAGLEFPGLAVVLDPSGEVVHKEVSGKEVMVAVTLRAAQLKRVREHRMRYFLPNRRNDLFPFQKGRSKKVDGT